MNFLIRMILEDKVQNFKNDKQFKFKSELLIKLFLNSTHIPR